jgi:hypothetical protein
MASATHSGSFRRTRAPKPPPEPEPVLWIEPEYKTYRLGSEPPVFKTRSEVDTRRLLNAHAKYLKRRETVDMVSTGIMGETEARGNYTPKQPVPAIMYGRNIMHPQKNLSKSASTPASIATPKSFYNEFFVKHRFPTKKEVIDTEPERIMWMLEREKPPPELSASQHAYSLPNMAFLNDHKNGVHHQIYGRGVHHDKRQSAATRHTAACPTPLSTSQEAFRPKQLPRGTGDAFQYMMEI